MAENTLGRRIVERQPEIKNFGVKRPLKAEVKIMNAFSAHAGRSELIDFGGAFPWANIRRFCWCMGNRRRWKRFAPAGR
jgi:metallo-beta-lactamase family protein